MDTADYVVVGTGSAGSVLAARLSEDPSCQVVALEAGVEDRNRFIHIPAGFSKLFRSDVDWDYLTEPQPGCAGRQIYWPRGKVLGGSSSVNAMMWVRGFAADYDEWAELAGQTWSFRELAGYFARIESVEGATEADEGRAGPLRVSAQRSPRRLTGQFLRAATEAGYRTERANRPQPDGFTQTMVTQRRGARWSAADAYLTPARRRTNLSVRTEALATRVIVEGSRAVGVQYQRDGRTHTVRARKEVVLAGGAVNTPQLLMLSGIGDAQQLQQHGIPVQQHLPAVGENLLDHLVSLLGYDVGSDSLYAAESIPQLVNYLVRRRGMLTSNVAEAYGFVRSRADLALPDLELIFAPGPFFDEGLTAPSTHGAVLGSILLTPASTGRISLRSADPRDQPVIDPRYLSDPAGVDRAAMLEGLRICHTIASAPSLRAELGALVRPRVTPQAPVDEVLDQALRTVSQTLYHPVGTCRMGTDPASVVTPELRVRGVDRLRVADASVMPTIIRGHTHAPSVVIGEKAADLLAQGR